MPTGVLNPLIGFAWAFGRIGDPVQVCPKSWNSHSRKETRSFAPETDRKQSHPYQEFLFAPSRYFYKTRWLVTSSQKLKITGSQIRHLRFQILYQGYSRLLTLNISWPSSRREVFVPKPRKSGFPLRSVSIDFNFLRRSCLKRFFLYILIRKSTSFQKNQ